MKPRYGHLDWLKVVAMYAVVVIHTIGHFVQDYHNSFDWFLANFLSMSARFAVPCFVMCSGAVFLRKEISDDEGLWAFYRRYLPRYLGYVAASLIVAKLYQLYLVPGTPLLKGLFYKFYSGMGTVSWFFFMFVGLILVTPMLRQVVRIRSMAWVFVLLSGFYTVVSPVLATRMGLYTVYIDNMLFPSFFVCYYVMGYLLDTTEARWSNRTLATAGAAALLAASLASYAANLGRTTIDEFYYYGSNPFVFLFTISVFLLFRNVFSRPAGPLVTALSRVTPVMYILHNFVLMSIKPVLGPGGLWFNFLWVVPVTAVVSWALALGYAAVKPLAVQALRRRLGLATA